MCFVGVSEVSKAYKLYDLISQKIINTWNAVFDEDKGWDWDNKYVEAILCDLDWGDQDMHGNVHDIHEIVEAKHQVRHGAETPEPDFITSEEDIISSYFMTAKNTSSPIQRCRRPPLWMANSKL